MNDVLITPAGLLQSLTGPVSPTVLDVRWALGGPSGAADYVAGHIPGAVFVDLDRDLAAPAGAGGRHPLPDADAFGAAMRRAGVSETGPVVVYAGATPGPAARAWWLLRYFGHPDVRVLDGGLDAWIAIGGALETGEPALHLAGDFVPRPGGLPLLDASGAAALAEHGLLLDVRTPERFRGESEPIDPVAGHIPGARNLPVGDMLGTDGRLIDGAVLHEKLQALGGTPAAPVGAYCGSGVSAAHAVLALAHAGMTASLYVGSWSDWITDPGRPVARGT